MLTLKINSVDQSSIVDWKSLVKTEVLTKEVDRLEFFVRKTPSKTIPAVNDDVVLLEDGTKIFGGIIIEKNDKIVGGRLVGYDFKCKDYSHLLDRKLVVKNYSNQSARSILLDIISTYTTGFTTANVALSTPNVSSIKFNYEQVSRAITQLCDQIGFDWYVDADKDIHFFAEESLTAPFDLDDTSGNLEWATLEVLQTIINLKNNVYVRGGEYKKAISEANAIDVYKGDGTQKIFPLAYRYATITVKKNGVVQTVGTDQQTDPATVDCLYNFNEKFIKFPSAVPSGQEVKIYGDALIPIIARVQDGTSVATYGEYQHVKIDKSITSVAEAYAAARAELRKFAENVYQAQFKTTKTGLKTGQKIRLNSPIRGYDKYFRINKIIGKARDSGSMEYQVSMIASGDVTFTDIMLELLGKDRKNITIAENEVVQHIEQLAEAPTIGDTVATSHVTSNPPYTWGPGGANDFVWGFFVWS